MDGLIAGYRNSEFARKDGHQLSLWAFTMINAMGDLFDVIPSVTDSARPNFREMSYQQVK